MVEKGNVCFQLCCFCLILHMFGLLSLADLFQLLCELMLHGSLFVLLFWWRLVEFAVISSNSLELLNTKKM